MTARPQVATLAELDALASRLAKLERAAARTEGGQWLTLKACPGGARRARRLIAAGKLEAFRLDGRGRLLFVRASDVDAMMVPVPVKAETPPVTLEVAAPCNDGGAYADSHLHLLAGGARR